MTARADMPTVEACQCQLCKPVFRPLTPQEMEFARQDALIEERLRRAENDSLRKIVLAAAIATKQAQRN